MIVLDKVFVVPLNNMQAGVKAIAITGQTAVQVVDHLLARKAELHLVCRPGFPSVILTESTEGAMIREVQGWLDRDCDLLTAAEDALRYLEHDLGKGAEDNDLLREAVAKETTMRAAITGPN